MIRAVLWDIDGTLIRTGGAGVKAFEKTFETVFGLPQATRMLKFAGRTDTSLVRECFALHGVPLSDENFKAFFKAYPLWLDLLLKELPGGVCEGVDEFMDKLYALPEPPLMGLLTGNVRLGAELKLRHYKLWHHFRTGAFADDHEDRDCIAGVAKQRAEEYLKARLSGADILVIGDTPHDITCAKSIGAKVVAVGTGNFTRAELDREKPTRAVDNLAGLDPTSLNGA